MSSHRWTVPRRSSGCGSSWSGETRASALDLDHAVQRVTEKTAERYAAYLADESVREKFEHLNATTANVVGINRWLDAVEGGAAPV